MNNPLPIILLIEDEPPIRRFLRRALYPPRVITWKKQQPAKRVCCKRRCAGPMCIILDLGLPDIDGLEVTRRLREWDGNADYSSFRRVDVKDDKIAVLDAGADDYLTKPFGLGELLARLRVALRHAARAGEEGEPVFRVGDLRCRFDTSSGVGGGKRKCI